jgi:hypothetical protein
MTQPPRHVRDIERQVDEPKRTLWSRAEQAVQFLIDGVLALVSIPLWLIVWLLTALGALLFISSTCDGPSKDRSIQDKHRTS